LKQGLKFSISVTCFSATLVWRQTQLDCGIWYHRMLLLLLLLLSQQLSNAILNLRAHFMSIIRFLKSKISHSIQTDSQDRKCCNSRIEYDFFVAKEEKTEEDEENVGGHHRSRVLNRLCWWVPLPSPHRQRWRKEKERETRSPTCARWTTLWTLETAAADRIQ